jgi:TRAP-type uncharacterized transport system fused permease subunit
VIVGVYALAACLQGYMLAPISPVGRFIVFLSAGFLLWPNNRYADLAGLALFAGYYLLQRTDLGDGSRWKRRFIGLSRAAGGVRSN